MSNFSSRLEIVVDSRTGERRLKYFRDELERTEKSGDRAFGSITQGVKNTVSALGPLGGIVASAFSVRQLTRYADGWSDLNARVFNVTKDVGLAEETMRRISDTARVTYSNLDQTAEAFLNNATTLTELGFSTERQLDLSDALNNALVISATKGQQAQSVMMALSRAFALGELRGDNFNSVIQNGGRIVEALADGLGVTTLELRKLASDGVLTTERVVNALTSQMEQLRKEAEEMPATIGDGFTLLGNATQELVGTFDRSFGVSEGIAGILVSTADTMRESADAIGDNLETIGNVAAGVAIVVGGRYVGAIGASTLAMGLARVEAMRYQAALASMAGVSRTAAASQVALATAARGAAGALAFVGGPLGAAVIAGSALYYFREELGLTGERLDGVQKITNEAEAAMKGLEEAIDDSSSAALDANYQELTQQLFNVGRAAAAARVELAELEAQEAKRRSQDSSWWRGATGGHSFEQRGEDMSAIVRAREDLAELDRLESELFEKLAANDEAREEAARRRAERQRVRQHNLDRDNNSNTETTRDLTKAAREAERELERLAGGFQSLYDRLRPIEASQRRYRDDQELINRAVEAGLLPLAEQSRLLRELERDFMNAGNAAEVYGFTGSGLNDPEQQSYWERWLTSAETAFTDFDAMAANTAESFQRGFGNAFETMVFDSKSAGDAARTMFEGVSRTAINALGQMAGQWLVYQGIQLATGRTMEASAIAGAATTGTAIASAYAPAATMASLASFGANSAPAMAGISSTFALSKSLALAGMAHDGIDRVPREGTWLLDRGERVMNRPQADRLDRYLEQQEKTTKGAGTVAPVVNIIEDASKAGQSSARQDDDGKWAIDVWVANVAQDGSAARMLEQTYGLRRQGR
ncbi:tape measure protein [Halomonas sp. MCCC 1A11036]|uniref:Tape measure protein n=1 Tax=Billgrantia zhangzhouensis TaxID=2733481 RepID=A0ABS9AEK6_9GAMM|nr:tape measure protein [Halomonas zhangzhouensis]MCE8020177.1 tape measure protein [Halomonas zhangzhouensis]